MDHYPRVAASEMRDLHGAPKGACAQGAAKYFIENSRTPVRDNLTKPFDGAVSPMQTTCTQGGAELRQRARPGRSEEHTSELQSQSNLVCRLLLEKKHS